MPLLFERNDITRMRVDAIVNAANETLLGGGGVDGAIHRAAGPGLLEECRKLGGCGTGEAKITGAYNLPSKWVIHTVGPIWRGGQRGEREQLRACYLNALALARETGCETVAFPLISSGVYGYPKDQALRVATEAITDFLKSADMTVTIVLFTREDFRPAGNLLGKIRAYIDDAYVFDRHTGAAEAPMEKYALQDALPSSGSRRDLQGMLDHMDASFSETLLRLIDERGMTDAECYRNANIDRRLFSKIRGNVAYRPSRQTALAFCVALRLNLGEAQALLARAGYTLSRSSKSDIVLEYCLENGRYDINEINEVLFSMDLPLLGA